MSLDAVAGLSEVPEPVQVPEPVHGALADLPEEVPEHLDLVIQEPLPGYMDVVVVLDSRRGMSVLVDALVRLIPVLEFVTLARGSLHAILECCNGSMASGLFTGMVYAPDVLEAVCMFFFPAFFSAFFELDWLIIDSFSYFLLKSSGQ